MEENQTTAAPNNGASNAADFQPPTQSPQTAPVADVQQQNGLQGVTNTQEFFNDNKSSQISITTNPAPAQAQVKSDFTTLVVIAIIAIVIGIILFKLSNKLPDKKTAKKEAASEPLQTEVEVEPEKEAVPEPEPEKDKTSEPKPKKSTHKKKTTKKTKRRNR